VICNVEEWLMVDRPVLLAVHAHPDDEVTSTGGVLAYYSRRGVRTIVVTCTNGEMGDAPTGIKPGQPGHDLAAVAAIRRAELHTACARLGVHNVELLGYHDSGMPEWDHQHQPNAFCNIPIDTVANRLAELIDRYRPDAVVTYNFDATYQHPDHMHTARATLQAVARIGIPDALFLIGHGADYYRRLDLVASAIGIDRKPPTPSVQIMRERIQHSITTTVDVQAVIDVKRNALLAHISQLESSLAAKIPADQWPTVFGTEEFIGVPQSPATHIPRTDLFADGTLTR
jgi:LmbE family N-acetylglucosaminyl deacetylase